MNKIIFLLILIVPLSLLSIEAQSVDDIFLKAKLTSNLNLYSNTKINNKSDNYNINMLSRRANYLNRNASVYFETAPFKGFSFKTRINGDIDSSDTIQSQFFNSFYFSNNTYFDESFLKYEDERFYLKMGKQNIFIGALEKYKKALIIGLDFNSNINLILGLAQKPSNLPSQSNIPSFFIGENSIYLTNLKYEISNNTKIDILYYYPLNQFSNWYTFKTVLKTNYFTSLIQYTDSKKSLNKDKNGYISHFKLNTNLFNFSLSAGYIKLFKEIEDEAKDIAINGISPFEKGNKIYSKDAKTFYGSIGYKFLDFDTKIIYKETLFNLDSLILKQDEINFLVKYLITNSFETSFLHTSIYSQELLSTQEKFILYLKYTF